MFEFNEASILNINLFWINGDIFYIVIAKKYKIVEFWEDEKTNMWNIL